MRKRVLSFKLKKHSIIDKDSIQLEFLGRFYRLFLVRVDYFDISFNTFVAWIFNEFLGIYYKRRFDGDSVWWCISTELALSSFFKWVEIHFVRARGEHLEEEKWIKDSTFYVMFKFWIHEIYFRLDFSDVLYAPNFFTVRYHKFYAKRHIY